MKLFMLLPLVLSQVFAETTNGGTGPYPAYYFEDKMLLNHTIYQPKNPEGLKVPVVVWGNGGCIPVGNFFAEFLGEVASWGALLIAPGAINASFPDASGGNSTAPPTAPPNGTLDTHPERLGAAIDWVVKFAGKDNYTHVDASRIAVWGQSCGGVEAYAFAQDDRVSSIGIFNSGQLTANESNAIASKVKKPIFYFLGGPDDVAYENGERDYSVLPKDTPSWLGNNKLGHGGSFHATNAGLSGVAAVKYMQWLLRGNETAAMWFKNGDALKAGFVDEKSQNLDAVKVKPI